MGMLNWDEFTNLRSGTIANSGIIPGPDINKYLSQEDIEKLIEPMVVKENELQGRKAVILRECPECKKKTPMSSEEKRCSKCNEMLTKKDPGGVFFLYSDKQIKEMKKGTNIKRR